MQRAQTIIDTLQALDPLSELPRTGWLLRGVRPCESIAEHSFGVAVATMLLVDALRADGQAVDGERALRMALLHDAAEARTGDIPMPNKHAALTAELHALEESIVTKILPPGDLEVWREAETGHSLEARLVKAADKIQMMVKLLVYERQHRGHLEEFWHNPRNFDDRDIPLASDLFDAICAQAGRPRPR